MTFEDACQDENFRDEVIEAYTSCLDFDDLPEVWASQLDDDTDSWDKAMENYIATIDWDALPVGCAEEYYGDMVEGDTTL